jgi:hypothetical protein
MSGMQVFAAFLRLGYLSMQKHDSHPTQQVVNADNKREKIL